MGYFENSIPLNGSVFNGEFELRVGFSHETLPLPGAAECSARKKKAASVD
jgi:hypothetical protein